MKEYDVIVVGSGAAGGIVAKRCNEAKMKVAVVDSRPFGGTCGLRGCDPKILLHDAAQLIEYNNNMSGKGVVEGRHLLDWKSLIEYKDEIIKARPEKYKGSLHQSGIDTYDERVYFYDENTLAAGDKRLKAKKIVIAAGSKHRTLNIEGEDLLTTSTDFMDLKDLPESIIFLGGGYVSFEFAHIAARTGSKVAILDKHKTPLANFDPDMANLASQAAQDAGIAVLLGKDATKVAKNEEGKLVVSIGDGQETAIADMVVHGAGRVPEVDDLGLKRGNVKQHDNNGGIVVDDHLQSVSNEKVYAAGDCAGLGYPLTPVAKKQGEIVAENIINGNVRKFDPTGIPTVVFTIPPVASIGITSRSVKGDHDVIYKDRTDWYSTKRLNQKYAASKILLDKETNKILGAHIIGPNAHEVINLFALAKKYAMTAGQLKAAIYSYPSIGYEISSMLDA